MAPANLTVTLRSDLDTLAVLLLLTALGSVLVRRLDHLVGVLVAQGALLTAVGALAAVAHGEALAWLGVGTTALVKVIAIPGVLFAAMRGVRVRPEAQAVLTRKQALPLAVALVLVAYYVAGPIAPALGLPWRNAVPAAVAMVLLGLFNMVTRRKAAAQVMALVTMENGLYLAAVATTGGLPATVELGVALDVLIGVVVMGIVLRQLYRTFATTDTEHLRTLRG